MASSPRLAASAAVISSLGRSKSLLVDGEVFPYFVADEISIDAGSGVRRLNLTILVDGPVSVYDEEALK